MTSQFRLGIIGCGRIAARHALACLGAEHVVLTALVDSAIARASSLAAEVGVDVRIADNLRSVLDSIDGAIIATPNHLHASLAIECLEARVPVLIEKPLAVSIEEGEQICRASAANRTVAAVGYVTRFRRNVQLMHELLALGYFGAVRRFAYQTGTLGGWAPLSGYNLDRRATGGGVLVVTGTHFLDRMLYWFGKPNQVSLLHDSLGGPEANAFATFDYSNAASSFCGTARFSKSVQMPTGFAMETDAGIVLIGEGSQPIRLWSRANSDLEVHLQPRDVDSSEGDNLFRLQIEDFVRAARDGVKPMVSAEEGLESLHLIHQLYANGTAIDDAWYSLASGAVGTEVTI